MNSKTKFSSKNVAYWRTPKVSGSSNSAFIPSSTYDLEIIVISSCTWEPSNNSPATLPHHSQRYQHWYHYLFLQLRLVFSDFLLTSSTKKTRLSVIFFYDFKIKVITSIISSFILLSIKLKNSSASSWRPSTGKASFWNTCSILRITVGSKALSIARSGVSSFLFFSLDTHFRKGSWL